MLKDDKLWLNWIISAFLCLAKEKYQKKGHPLKMGSPGFLKSVKV